MNSRPFASQSFEPRARTNTCRGETLRLIETTPPAIVLSAISITARSVAGNRMLPVTCPSRFSMLADPRLGTWFVTLH